MSLATRDPLRSWLLVFLIGAGLMTHAWSQEAVRSNLVQNPRFDETSAGAPAAWEQRTWSGDPIFVFESEAGRNGGPCVRIDSTAGADASWSQRIEIRPHTDYRLSAWVKTLDLADGGFGAQLNLHELQMEGKTEPIRGTSDWTQLTSQFNSGPRDAVTLNLLFGGWGRATGTAWFDDIELVELKREIAVPSMTAEQAGAFFEKEVFPILKEHCFECHGETEDIRGGLALTYRDGLLEGGDSGPAVDEESPLDSLLLSAVNYESYEMPPAGKLKEDQIAKITTWVQLGAPWQGAEIRPEAMEKESRPLVTEESKQWWSYQPPRRPAPPETASPWPHNDIDRFVLGRLDQEQATPNPRASRATLIRRAYYDLLGLPPSREAVEAFVNDPASDREAFAALVEELLASPHYGEKWARHWLDLVRYAESNSYERDGTKPFVWRYRDYVIRSFNDNKPYDEFVVEQLAGDELPGFDPDHLIATGYYRLGIWDDEPADPKQAWFDDMDDVLATTSQAFLGMTINCARCHDHKIDPVPQTDYYRMLAFFRNVQRYGVRGHDTVLRQSTRSIAPPEMQQQHAAEIAAHRERVGENRRALKELEEWVKQDFIDVEHQEFEHEMNRVALVEKRVGKTIDGREFTRADFENYASLFKTMRTLRDEQPPALEAALCVTEKGSEAPETHVLIRGNANVEGDPVEPGFPIVLSPPDPEIETPEDGKSTGRRLALARWIASPENPLTARVMANRIWQHHFGRGIVRSTNDFGFQGRPPTHPELLDWLAVEFMESGWDIKHLHRLVMNSQTYQMASTSRPEMMERDPLNDWFWRYDMRRLTAEEIRDSILAVNDTLNLDRMFGPSIFPTIPQEVLDGQSRPGENWFTSSPEEQARRSIYIHIKRSLPVPLLASFDAADTDTTCPVRFDTVQPTQALGMLNSAFINDEAAKLARFVSSDEEADPATCVRRVLQRVFQRTPTETEIERGVTFIEQQVTEGHSPQKALELFCVVAYNLNEFLFLD